ncbi:N-acetylglucosaminyldiphosphodolichol N-acetylglucosaminyltransferase catalytic subunit alg13 [Savitreella phatthalungensis]
MQPHRDAPPQDRAVFVTVGSTSFDDLVSSVLSRHVLDALVSQGYNRLTIQHGDTNLTLPASDLHEFIPISLIRYSHELPRFVSEGELIISHAGAGSVLDVLTAGPVGELKAVYTALGADGKRVRDRSREPSTLGRLRRTRKLIIVPNNTLMDNHQVELARQLSKDGYCLTCSIAELASTIQNELAEFRPRSWPKTDGAALDLLVDEELAKVLNRS